MKSALLLLLAPVVTEAGCPNQCAGKGTCGSHDQCTCDDNYMGNDCSMRMCPYAKSWITTSKGDLNMNGAVTDYTVYSKNVAYDSVNSALLITQKANIGTWESFPAYARKGDGHFYMECANRGSCDREKGQCECHEGYTGAACERMTCPNDCSGKGRCLSTNFLTTAKSDNYDGWYNKAPEASTYNFWDGDMAMSCDCDAKYSGADCSTRVCPMGDDILTTTHQQYETQWLDIYSTCDDIGASCADVASPNVNDVLGGSITLTYTDSFGEEHTTGLISGVKAFGGALPVLGDLASNAQAALTGLPNNVLPDTVTVSAMHCEMFDPNLADVSTAGVVTNNDAALVTAAIRILGGPTVTNAVVVADTGVLLVPSEQSTETEGFLTKGDTVSIASALTAVEVTTIEHPSCVRLVVRFNGVAGDIKDLKVNTDEVTFGGYTNAQNNRGLSGSTVIDSSVTDKIQASTAKVSVSYTAPNSVSATTTGWTSSVTSTAGVTNINLATAAIISQDATNTFYPEQEVEVTCTVKDANTDVQTTRSIGTHKIKSITSGADPAFFTVALASSIPAETISSAGCTTANIAMTSKSHVVVLGSDADDSASGDTDTAISPDFVNTFKPGGSSSHDVSIIAQFTAASASSQMVGTAAITGATVDIGFASSVSACHTVAIDSLSGSEVATTTVCILSSSEFGRSYGRNAALAAAGTVAQSSTILGGDLLASAIDTGVEDFISTTQTLATIFIDGKGTHESVECGNRGICDSEAAECKCFEGYTGLSCNVQSSITA